MPQDESPRLYLDVTDPLSFVMNREVHGWELATGGRVNRLPFPWRSTGSPLTDTTDFAWLTRLRQARALLPDVAAAVDDDGRPARLVPDAAKAHELVIFAEHRERGADALRRLSLAFLQEGLDIGRIDVLVALGETLGFDALEVKVTLDVDAHAPALADILASAHSGGVESPPCLVWSGRTLQGYHNRRKIVKFLDGAPVGASACLHTPEDP